MLFNSLIFITVFLPLALTGWYLLQRLGNPAYAKLFLAGMSFWFYGYYNISYLWILLFSLILNYALSALFDKARALGLRRVLLLTGVFLNLGMLFYYKYFNFFIENCNFFLHTDIFLEKIALPLGISFFTFQQLSYVIERYRGSVEHYDILDYSCFISFFPQLIAGPIVLHSEFVPQLRERKCRRLSAGNLFDGAALFILGLAKKVLLADMLAVLVNAEYNNIIYLDAFSAWVTIIAYMLELYFDFSGYCDMARGIGKMFGFELPENFRSPLMADSVKDFWKRWHITLSRFFTSYVYIPLGGNRTGKARQCINLMAVFLASGVWHGANWTFIVWGAVNGIAVVAETVFPKFRFRAAWLNRLATGIFEVLAFSIFRSESLQQAALLWKKLFTGGNTGMLIGISNVLQFPENYVLRKAFELLMPEYVNIVYLVTLAALLVISIILVRGSRAQQWIEEKGRTVSGLLCLATLFTWSFISLSQVSTFLYFNF